MTDVRETSGVGNRQGALGSSARSNLLRIPIKVENSFRLEPLDNIPRSSIMKIIRETFESMLVDKSYNESECPKLVRLLSEMIKDQVKALGYPRYKIISLVSLGPSKQSTMVCASRFVWNDSVDTYAEYAYKNSSLYAVGTVFAIYVD